MPVYSFMGRRLLYVAYCSVVSMVLGCSGDVSRAFRIDQGIEPSFQDENVRFRTTYYFRTLTICPNDGDTNTASATTPAVRALRGYFVNSHGTSKVMSDSLYRFRMTGQASALFQEIHFESGVLRKEQIDPFGSAVTFDEQAKAFVISPANEVREKVAEQRKYDEIRRLLKLHDEIKRTSQLPASTAKLDAVIAAQVATFSPLTADLNDNADINRSAPRPEPKLTGPSIEAKVTTVEKALPLDGPSDTTAAEAKVSISLSDAKIRPTQSGQAPVCTNGSKPLYKFLLLGPEGARELDPNDRLLMTMSSDSKPLIGVLQQLSNRQLQSQQSSIAAQQAVLSEAVKVYDAHHLLLDVENELSSNADISDETSPSQVVTKLRSVLDPNGRGVQLNAETIKEVK